MNLLQTFKRNNKIQINYFDILNDLLILDFIIVEYY